MVRATFSDLSHLSKTTHVILFLVLSLQSTQQRPLSPLIPTQILHKYAEAFCRIYLKGKSDGIPWRVELDELLRQVDL